MPKTNLYVKVGGDYIKFTKNGEYVTTKNRMNATPFLSKTDIVRACRKAKITNYKIASSNLMRI